MKNESIKFLSVFRLAYQFWAHIVDTDKKQKKSKEKKEKMKRKKKATKI